MKCSWKLSLLVYHTLLVRICGMLSIEEWNEPLAVTTLFHNHRTSSVFMSLEHYLVRWRVEDQTTLCMWHTCTLCDGWCLSACSMCMAFVEGNSNATIILCKHVRQAFCWNMIGLLVSLISLQATCCSPLHSGRSLYLILNCWGVMILLSCFTVCPQPSVGPETSERASKAPCLAVLLWT